MVDVSNRFVDGRYARSVAVEGFAADARTGELVSRELTTSGTPGTVTSLNIPDWVRGFRLYPRANRIRFAVGEDPAAASTSAFVAGGVAQADQWEVRTIEDGTSRTLRVLSATASVVVDVELF